MCGILALLLADTEVNAGASAELYEALGILQHRGQDAAGIVTCGARGRLYQCKGNGLVRDVFDEKQLVNLMGYMGVAHVRYPTAGSNSNSEAQPFYVNSPYGIVVAHNGNLTNAKELAHFLDVEAHRHVNTDSDSELLLNIFANELQKTGKFRLNEDDTFNALKSVYEQCRGGYACTMMIAGFGIIGFRDPNGIRPLVYGTRIVPGQGHDFMFASESVALEALGFSNVQDVGPGEAIIVTKGQRVTKRQVVTSPCFTPCIFEYVYFARPDSIMDGVSVYKCRLAMGEALAKQIGKCLSKLDIDVVIPVPDTSRVAALQAATCLGIPYREGFIKNRYIGRTFIMPGQQLRKKNVRRKLNPMVMEFQDKNVLIVDDSIVRGTTSKEIIQMARECGARKVYFASCAPPIRYPNVYGIDMPTRKELVAYSRTTEQVASEIGADFVIYQDLSDLIYSVSQFNPLIESFDVSVFSGCYVTEGITDDYLADLERSRSDSSKVAKVDKAMTNGTSALLLQANSLQDIGLHNLHNLVRFQKYSNKGSCH
ncbi:amidophosphoribosyltransferase [Synchytrium endobioticum]|uniref:Amidophosphoribosyltransferase n=1 Tax=Synchytrium endobioticum TaxID=286115 RepID=A0A507DJ16_9FUNG|nr:amidophosphoribosyltransferase [Synchytrium endobioticum]TPX54881.1 amidophosphoribosyltransferase [Synchytrium endobioticum]